MPPNDAQSKNKEAVALDVLLTLFFRLFRVKDKSFRQLLLSSIVAEICAANRPRANPSLNRKLQGFMFDMLTRAVQPGKKGGAKNPPPPAKTESKDSPLEDAQEVPVAELADILKTPAPKPQEQEQDPVDPMLAFKSLQVTVELYRRGIWSDDRTVNILALASLAKHHTKLAQLALNFFIGRIPKLSESLMDDDVDVACADGTGKGGRKGGPGQAGDETQGARLFLPGRGELQEQEEKADRLAAATERRTRPRRRRTRTRRPSRTRVKPRARRARSPC